MPPSINAGGINKVLNTCQTFSKMTNLANLLFENNGNRSSNSPGYSACGVVSNVALWYYVTMSSGESTIWGNLVHGSAVTLSFTAWYFKRWSSVTDHFPMF